jgi:uracil-DNA glycosylase
MSIEIFKSEIDKLDSDWKNILNNGFAKKELNLVCQHIDKIDAKEITPPLDQVFNAFKFPFSKLKVLILGQDPYQQKGYANGLAFSCVKKIPASLKKIHAVLLKDGLVAGKPQNGNLEIWRDQGVLLLNKTLTTVVGKSNAHVKFWEKYVDTVCKRMCGLLKQKKMPLVCLLWGANAQKFDFSNATVFKCAHPAARKKKTDPDYFGGNKHFILANEKLEELKLQQIDWSFAEAVPKVPKAKKAKSKTGDSKKPKVDIDAKKTESETKTDDSKKPKVDIDAKKTESDVDSKKPKVDIDAKKTESDVDAKKPKVESEPKTDVEADDAKAAAIDELTVSDIESAEERAGLDKSVMRYFETDALVCFTDGSCSPNKASPDARGGYAAVFVNGYLENKQIYGNLNTSPLYATNIRAEGKAIERALIYANQHAAEWSKLLIITDCQNWSNGINNNYFSWSDEKFKEQKNTDITTSIWSMWEKMRDNGKDVRCLHMRAHNKSGWGDCPSDTYENYCYLQNEYVDKLAKYARENMEPGKMVIDDVSE